MPPTPLIDSPETTAADGCSNTTSCLQHFNLRLLLFVTILAGLLLSACSEPDHAAANAADNNTQAVPVRLTTVEMRQDDEMLRFASVSRVRQRADLTFQVSGVIRQRTAEIGQTVQTGQTLMSLYSPSLQPSYDAARHRLVQLQAEQQQSANELQRLETLYARGVIPRQELEQQQTRMEALSAAVANAEALAEQAARLLQESELRAPFDASIEQVLREPGEFVQAGQPVLRIAAATDMEAEIRIPAHLAQALTVGQTLPVWNSIFHSDNSAPAQFAHVVEISQSSTGNNNLYPIVVALGESGFSTGEAIEIGVPRNSQPALVIPMSAVMRSADGLTVFTNHNGRAQRTAVEVEQLQGEFVVIKPGALSAGTQIVYAGITRLADGDPIEALP